MDSIRQERPNKGPISNIHKMHYRQSLNMIFGTPVENLRSLRPWKNKQCIIPRNKVISGKFPWQVKM